MKFINKTVIITGGGTEIGRKTAVAFFTERANVIINRRRKDVIKQTAYEKDALGNKYICDKRYFGS